MEIEYNTDQQFTCNTAKHGLLFKNKFWFGYLLCVDFFFFHFIEVTLVYQGRYSQQTMAMGAMTKIWW